MSEKNKESIENKAEPEQSLPRPQDSLPKRIEELEEALRQEHEKAENYFKRLQYMHADFENYRKRVEKERIEMNKASLQRLIANLLSVADELELAIHMASKSDDRQQIVKGIEVILNKFYEILHAEGLQVIKAEGEYFDPNLHEAVESVEVEDDKVGKVVQEMRKGFIFDGKVLRPSVVKVGIQGGDRK
ncbi:MAG: nucleotide exchange factor GrpE [Conexivisphaerales archaeon]